MASCPPGAATEVIERHMWEAVDAAAGPEGHLLELSNGMDLSGWRTDDLPPDLRADGLDGSESVAGGQYEASWLRSLDQMP